LPAASTGSSYSQSLAASGGTPPYTWSSTGTLPSGLTLDSSGNLTGTALLAVTSTFTVTATDAGSATGSRTLTLAVTNPTNLTLVTPSLPGGTVNSNYSQTLTAVGGTTPYGWSLTNGSLPPGLNLTNGNIQGTPSQGGTFNFTLRLADAAGGFVTRAYTVSIASLLNITTLTLSNATAGSAYSQTLQATNGTAPYAWSLAPGSSLPNGLTLGTNGVISGTPSTVSSSSFTVQVQDAASLTTTRAFTLNTIGNLTWDSDGATGGQQNGAGSWNLSNTNWLNGSTNVSWVQGSDATFGGGTGTAGAITLSEDIAFRHLTFNATTNGGTYTMTGTGRTLSLGSTTSTIIANTEGSINVKLAGTSFTKAGSGRLILNEAGYEGNVAVTGELRLTESSNRIWNGTISGGGNITKYGSGRLTLTASNPLTGFFTVTEGGFLRITHPWALGTTTNNTTVQGGTNFCGVELDNPAGMTVGEPFQLVM
ncbi:MAG: hypothetical protein EBV83_09730, partial [Verrucomicrobia bacterium]|nr:hypothetical protein [Verrucomicrobiota bacterium]